MKKYILISLCLLTAAGSFAQNKDFKFKFYGQIRTDFYYNSRANARLFHLSLDKGT